MEIFLFRIEESRVNNYRKSVFENIFSKKINTRKKISEIDGCKG